MDNASTKLGCMLEMQGTNLGSLRSTSKSGLSGAKRRLCFKNTGCSVPLGATNVPSGFMGTTPKSMFAGRSTKLITKLIPNLLISLVAEE